MLERYRRGEKVYVLPCSPVQKDDDIVIWLGASGGQPSYGYIRRLVSMDDEHVRVLQLNPRKVLTFPRQDVDDMHRVIMWGSDCMADRPTEFA